MTCLILHQKTPHDLVNCFSTEFLIKGVQTKIGIKTVFKLSFCQPFVGLLPYLFKNDCKKHRKNQIHCNISYMCKNGITGARFFFCPNNLPPHLVTPLCPV